MKTHSTKIHDTEPHEASSPAGFSKAVFWLLFALITAGVGIGFSFKGESFLIPLSFGLSALGVIFSFKQMGKEACDE